MKIYILNLDISNYVNNVVLSYHINQFLFSNFAHLDFPLRSSLQLSISSGIDISIFIKNLNEKVWTKVLIKIHDDVHFKLCLSN